MKRHGFTLIELLIVMTLIGLGISVVAPLGMTQLEKSRAFDEAMQLEQFCQSVSNKAYLSGQQLTITTDNNTLLLAYTDAKELTQLEFRYLSFPRQQITFNQHGFADVAALQYLLRGAERQLEFPAFIGRRQFNAE